MKRSRQQGPPVARALLVADRPGWVYDRKARIFLSLSGNFQADLGYVCPREDSQHWLRMHERNHYDIIWNLGFRMGHDPVHRDNEHLAEFVQRQNAAGSAVVATVSNSLVHFPLPSRPGEEEARVNGSSFSPQEWELSQSSHEEDLAAGYGERVGFESTRLRLFNGVAVNNKFAFARLSHAGVACRLVPDGVNGDVYQCMRPVRKREFGILFVSSSKKQQHKGIELFRRLTERLAPLGVRSRAVIADSSNNKRTPEMMAKIYNRYPIFICASRAEGGPATLLEAAACGCVPITTAVGYSDDIVGNSGGFIVRRQLQDFLEKVLLLRDNPQLLERMSMRVRKIVQTAHWRQRIPAFEQFLLDHLLV